MKITVAVLAGAIFAGVVQAQSKTQSTAPFVIVEHHVVPATETSEVQRDEYTVLHGNVVLKVEYEESQTSSAKPGDFPGTGLHLHQYYPNPDLSQVPKLRSSVRQCTLDKQPDHDGDPVIAIQSTPEPCMVEIGDILRYEPSPNGPDVFTYVNFDIIDARIDANNPTRNTNVLGRLAAYSTFLPGAFASV
jgi:hypothetical protein